MSTPSLRRPVLALTAALLATSGVAVIAAHPAEAASRRTLCADNATVRDPANNQPVGVLYRGESFDLDHYSPSGGYAVGYAYGGEGPTGNGVAGMVIANTITDAAGHCQAPYA